MKKEITIGVMDSIEEQGLELKVDSKCLRKAKIITSVLDLLKKHSMTFTELKENIPEIKKHDLDELIEHNQIRKFKRYLHNSAKKNCKGTEIYKYELFVKEADKK